jgi:hypothetical protein
MENRIGEKPMIHPAHAQAIQKAIEDIKGIIAVLDPAGYKQAEEWKKERIGRESMENKLFVDALEKRLNDILPEGWEERFETHEDRYELFERSFDTAESIARQAIKALREGVPG